MFFGIGLQDVRTFFSTGRNGLNGLCTGAFLGIGLQDVRTFLFSTGHNGLNGLFSSVLVLKSDAKNRVLKPCSPMQKEKSVKSDAEKS